jgi:hypothetical protein
MLRIGGIRAASEGKQARSAQKAFRHLATSYRQTRRLPEEEVLEELVPLDQTLFDLAREFICRCHRVWPLTNSSSSSI